jgi:hypothetical protein
MQEGLGARLAELRRVFADAVKQAVGEEGLRHRDEDGAAELLEKRDARRGYGDVGEREHGLYYEDAALETDARAETAEDLVADPFGAVGVEGEGRYEGGAAGRD